jgi:hypothetical protein
MMRQVLSRMGWHDRICPLYILFICGSIIYPVHDPVYDNADQHDVLPLLHNREMI